MSGAVYQPTTVTYENNCDRWQDRPISYLASTVTEVASTPCGISCVRCSRRQCAIVLLFIVLILLNISLLLIIVGTTGYMEGWRTEQSIYYFLLISGAILFVVTLVFFGILLIVGRCRWSSGKDHLDIVGSPGMTINPSTDYLVTAQYAPVSEVVYQPAQQEDSEQCKLMPQENKDLKDDTDCMIERDPRIVLRPLNQPIREET